MLLRSEKPIKFEDTVFDPFADIKEKIFEYITGFDETGRAPQKNSFGTLSPEEQMFIKRIFVLDEEEGFYLPGSSNMAYKTILTGLNNKPLYMIIYGDYGIQIDYIILNKGNK